MAVAVRSWEHARWRYDADLSPAARRSAARAAARSGEEYVTWHQAERAPAASPALRLVRRPRVRVGSILLVVAFLGVALAAPVGLNLAVVRTEWQIAGLRQQQDDAVAERSTLRAEHAALSSTQRVKETADRLGMVAPAEVGFIDLGNGAGTATGSGGESQSATLDPASAGGDGATLASVSGEVGAGR